MPNAARTGLLILAATAGAFGVGEIALRYLVDQSTLHPRITVVPELAERHYEMRFHESFDPSDQALAGHDAELGWDFDIGGDRIRDPLRESFAWRAVAIGDSYTYGLDVGPDENFPALLRARFPHGDVLNMAVPGYGIDQAVLKYLRHGGQYAPRFVLLGIYVGDYARSTVRFTSFAKPKFVLDGNRLRLSNVPVPTPQQAYERLSLVEPGWRWPMLLRSTMARISSRGDEARSRFLETTDAVVEQLLRKLAAAGDHEIKVVLIPRGDAFTDPEPLNSEIADHLRAIFERQSIPYLDLAMAFEQELPRPAITRHFYAVSERGSVGHLNPAGHRLVAERLGAWIDERLSARDQSR